MKILAILLSTLVLIITLVWLIFSPGWEPLVSSIGALSALIGSIVLSDKGVSRKLKMSQRGGENSTNYQAGGDIKINGNDK